MYKPIDQEIREKGIPLDDAGFDITCQEDALEAFLALTEGPKSAILGLLDDPERIRFDRYGA